MEAQTMMWLVFLVLTKYVSTINNENPFKLEPGLTTATEGSCFEIKCTVIRELPNTSAYWFWMKDARWDNKTKDFISTVIYSNKSWKRPVSPDFVNRVTFIGSSSDDWKNGHYCNILICDLRRSDSGEYSLRYVGTKKEIWRSESVTLEVEENRCPLTFKKPPVVQENEKVTLTCSTPTSCTTFPHIQDVTQRGLPNDTYTRETKSTTITFKSSREDDERVFFCKTQDNTDKYLIRNITVTVEYSPDVEINIIPPGSAYKTENEIIVTSGVTLSLTCDVKRSNPQPYAYSWYKGGNIVGWAKKYIVKMTQPGDRSSYTCRATNTKGTGRSKPLQLDVQYKPRAPRISISGSSDHQVKVNQLVTFTCDTDANPAPTTYSWYRDNIQYTDWMTTESSTLDHQIQRADETCYECRATNHIGRGDKSWPVCIQVLYPPTQPKLSMPAEVTEGQRISISCTAESFPPSHLTLTRINTSDHQSLGIAQEAYYSQPINTLHQRFTVTSAHAGLYSCSARNTEGIKHSEQKLVVKYPPENVKVEAYPGLAVKENASLTLICSAESYPPVSAVTWMKTTDGKDEILQKNLALTFTVNSATTSDSGLYSCEATNDFGTLKSQPAEVKVKYAPRNTNITGSAVKQERDGRSSVTLSCISHSFPPVDRYTWYRKKKGMENYEVVSKHQNYTVYSDKPGVYYCVAENEVDKRSSDPVHLFERDYLDILKFFFSCLLVLMIIIFVFLILRKRRKNSIQQVTRNTFSFCYLCWRNGTRRRSLMNETVSAEPFRSREDLLSEQLRRPQAQRHQQLPDSTPRTNVDQIYSVVNLPKGASAQKPTRQQNGDTEADSVNYASLNFLQKPKNKQRKEETYAVYAIVSKPKEPDSVQDYENVSKATACASRSPNLFDDGEDEVELNYSQVIFTATPRRQITDSDSSTSSEDESQYSDIRI